jgi:hypothetical protein
MPLADSSAADAFDEQAHGNSSKRTIERRIVAAP